MSSKGRPTSYKIRKTFAHAMELELYNLGQKYAEKVGRNLNEIINTVFEEFLKAEGFFLSVNLPKHIQMVNGRLVCRLCADMFIKAEEALNHNCLNRLTPLQRLK